jgi:hypothetical protein
MSQKYRLAIGDRVAVRIQGKIPGDTRGTHTNLDFTLDMERMDQDQINEAVQSGEQIADFLTRKVRGWSGQTLVRDENDQPASFCEDAFRALLRAPGMGPRIWTAYLRDLGVQEKN